MIVGVPTRSGNRLRFLGDCCPPSTYRTYQWNILEAFLAQKYLYVNPYLWIWAKTVDFRCRRTLSAGMAWASVRFALRGLKAHAIPAGVAAFRSNQRCSASDYESVKAFMEL